MNKIKFSEKLSFLVANIGNIPVMTLTSSFLSIFYVTVLGMDEFKVGTMFLLARVFDGVNDPFIGYFMDRQKNTRFGKFRKMLIVGTFLCALNYCALWFGVAGAPENLKLAIAYISYFLLGVTFPIMDISLNSSLPLMTDDLKERNILSSVKIIGYGVGTALCGVVAPMLISNMGSDKKAYLTVIGAFIALVVVCSTGGTLGFKQNVRFKTEKHYTVKDLFKIITVSPVLVTFITALFYYSGYNFIGTANTYYAQYVLGDVGKLTMITIFNAAGMVPIVFLAPVLTNRFGKPKVYGFGMILAGIGFAIKAFCVDNSALGFIMCYLSAFISGMGIAFAMILNYGIQADNIDYVEYALDKRSEGAVSALSSMITKIGMGIGGAVPLYVLGATKTAAGEYSKLGLALSDAVLPCAACVIAGIIFISKYPISKTKLESIHEELVERRKQL